MILPVTAFRLVAVVCLVTAILLAPPTTVLVGHIFWGLITPSSSDLLPDAASSFFVDFVDLLVYLAVVSTT